MDLRTTPAGRRPVWTFVISTSAPALHREQYQSQTPLKQLFSSIRPFVSMIAVLTAALMAPSVYATAPVGATPGSFAVSPSGAATYTIPIVIPPGTHGMQPNFALVYNGQTGNGMLGVGWSLSGLSVIHHCGATIAIDGFKGGVNYDGNDRFCLDGERLINIGNNEYRSQHESWQRVIASDATTNPASFTVYERDGSIRYYGTTSDSRIAASSPNTSIVRLWALNQIQDRNGNYFTITYQNNGVASGEYYPLFIAYTGNGSVVPYNFVYFDYQTRSDVISYYEAGSLIQTAHRLSDLRSCTDTACTVGVNGSLVRQYNLTYDNNGAVGRSRLTSIQECSTDGVCVPATALAWTPAPASPVGVSANASISANPFSLKSADINGDGRDDLVWQDASNSDFYTALALPGSPGFGPAAYSGLYVPLLNYHYPFSVGDINGDGIGDLGAGLGSFLGGYLSLQYALATASGLGSPWSSSVYMCSGGYCPGPTLFADIDGDGRVDAIGYANTGSPYTFYYTFSTGNGFGSLHTTSTGAVTSTIPGDFNGDGRSDLLCKQQNGSVSGFNYALSTGTGLGPCLNTGLSGTPTAGPWPADINGDGKSDLVWIQGNNIYYAFSTGMGFTIAMNSNVSVNLVAAANVTVADINGDGLPDAVWMGNDGYIHYSPATGNGFAPAINSGVTASISSGPWTVDFNGDGKQDLVWLFNGTIYSSLAQGEPTDLLQSITDGLGVQTTVSYKPLTDGTVYTKDNTSVYPYQDVSNATYVVASYTQSNGINGANTATATYGGLKRHLTANAGLGFRWMSVTDPAGITHATYFNQTLDGTEGTIAASETWANGVRVTYTGNTWAPVALGNGRTLARLASAVEQTRELNNGIIITTVNTTYSAYDAYGNPSTVVVNFNDGWSKTTNNTYNNDTVNWQLGQLLQSQVTANAPGQTAQTRTSRFTYDALGRLASEMIEPDNTTLWLKSAYAYDAFGNRTKKTVSGPDIVTRDEYTLAFDSRGQFVATNTNALGHKTTYNSYDPRNGAVTKLTDPNGLITQWAYNDGLARLTQETRPDTTTTTYTYQGCDSSCPALAKTMAATTTSGAGTSWVYRDMLGREVRKQSQGFGGAWVYRDSVYDALGRISSVSLPNYSGGAVYSTTYAYDPLNRVKAVTEPGAAGSCNGPGRTTVTAYNGLTMTVTNPKCQQKTTVKNSQGQMISVTDAAGTMSYQYEPFGNLLQVTGVDNAVTAMTYDLRGRKKTMSDPDMGAWSYNYDALGELTSQTDAKGKYTNMGYDKLGRLSYRTTPDTINSWAYDTATLGNTGRSALGKLAAVYGNSATETYTYDNLARVSTDTMSIGGVAYATSYAYDANSRIQTLTYPETGFKLYHVYDTYGYLTEVRQDNATGLCFWKATAVDAGNRVTQESLGNGLGSNYVYDAQTADLLYAYSFQSGASSFARYSQQTYDALHNLSSRTWWDGSQYDTETFGYDEDGVGLNRLTSVTGPANKTYRYAANGNITYKSDVGTYTYPTNGIQPHAVASVAGAVNTSYAYDANGNMTAGNGRTITYYSFNKPKTIANAYGTTMLTYDANFNRLIKATASSTIIYIGKRYERVTSGSTVTQRHFLYAGSKLIGVYNVINGTPATNYFLTDHLGSVDTVVNASGTVVARYGYDAHGKRRYPNGADAPINSYLGGARRGYTAHEHDDEVGLVNMDAREYDYVLGRFITPDTIIPGTTNSQAFNRYSYVNNNPLSRTDPSGRGNIFSNAWDSFTSWVSDQWDKARDTIHRAGEWVGRASTNVVGNLSQVPYVGGLLATGYLSSPMFGSTYGATTGDWNSVGRATATAGVLAASWWSGNALYTNYGGLTYVAGSYGIGYAAGYSISSIYGASSAQARDAASKGGNAGAAMALFYLGWDAMSNSVNAGARASGNTSECVAGPCTAGSRTSTLGYDKSGNPRKVDSLTGFANQGMGPETLAGQGHPELRAPHSWDWIPGAKEGIEFVSKTHDFGNSFTYLNGLYQPSTSAVVNDLFNVYSMSTMLPSAAYTACAFGCLYFELNDQMAGP